MAVKQTIKLNPDQYISDFSHRIPTTKGVHLIIAGTGYGKSHWMIKNTHKTVGVSVYPIKAIMHQQKIEKHRRGLPLGDIIQIEHLGLSSLGCALHVDEAQILYTGGFRKSVERLLETVKETRISHPVYLLSADPRLEQLLPVDVDTITVFDKEFIREHTVIQIEGASANLKQYDSYISSCLSTIHRENSKPVLAFINSIDQCEKIRNRLLPEGFKVAVLSSALVGLNPDDSPVNTEANQCYQRIIEDSAIGGCGFDVVLTTDVLAEGINIHDDFNVVVLQDEAGKNFQRYGRARGVASHWLITGSGTDRLKITDSHVIHEGEHQYIIKPYTGDIYEPSCLWSDSKAKHNATLYSTFVNASGRGIYALQGIKELDTLGYQPTSLVELNRRIYERVKNTKIKKLDLINAIELFDCPLSWNPDHQLIKHLLDRFTFCQLHTALQEAIEWRKSWDIIDTRGFKLDCWNTYRVTSKYSRAFLVSRFMKTEHTEHTVNSLHNLKSTIDSIIQDVKNTISSGYLTIEQVGIIDRFFWVPLVNSINDPVWFSEGFTKQRQTLLKIFIGADIDKNKHWYIPEDKPWWDSDLSRAEQSKLSRAFKPYKDKGMDRQQFHEHLGLTSREVVSMKPKALAALALDGEF